MTATGLVVRADEGETTSVANRGSRQREPEVSGSRTMLVFRSYPRAVGGANGNGAKAVLRQTSYATPLPSSSTVGDMHLIRLASDEIHSQPTFDRTYHKCGDFPGELLTRPTFIVSVFPSTRITLQQHAGQEQFRESPSARG
ncbi:hypothetical protein BV898_19956 [Hypsibius exemplaris]|uniref:Uncharacterized protein n=1 Tax=Hypsibius exemplaris TaxID=2072580 RepID=A0A9X6NT01_HYPEX|nr:hypothetical protein BV898_19956 [Hypsibius exemplaris]